MTRFNPLPYANYAEASYPFDGFTPHHFQHIAARDERDRIARIEREGARLVRRLNRNITGRI
jgi:hypothetical protein